YISLLDKTINRMATCSANCKAWLIALITGSLTISDKITAEYIWIFLFPSFLFFFLDSYYLGIQRRFILIEQDFLKKLRKQEDVSNLIYSFNIKSLGSNWHWTFSAMKSLSTAVFYLSIIACIVGATVYFYVKK
ncbi:MAG: hypothetical protein NC453_27885, partial [Muribaculum sp.]|nr:hypothetical protein [Muribaculum sp.]